MKAKSLLLVISCVGVLFCGKVTGSPMAPWSASDAAWVVSDISLPSAYDPVAVTRTSDLVGNDVTIQFRAVTAGQEGSWFPVGRVSTTAGTLLGDWTVAPSIQFTLSNDNGVTPVVDGLRMYFISGATTYYSSTITAPLSGTQAYGFILANLFGGAPLTGITEFGFEIASYNSLSAHSYTFNDIGLSMSIPEPETVWMMLVVLLSLAVTFRQRLAEVASQIKSRLVA